MTAFNYHYRYRLGVRSHPFISIGSQSPSWKPFELIFQHYCYPYRLEMFLNKKGHSLNMTVQGRYPRRVTAPSIDNSASSVGRDPSKTKEQQLQGKIIAEPLRISQNLLELFSPEPKSTPLLGFPLLYRAPSSNFILQNVKWRPPKCKLTPSKRDWRPPVCSFCIELHRNLPSPMYSLEGVNLHFGGWHCLGGALQKRGDLQKKRGALWFSP